MNKIVIFNVGGAFSAYAELNEKKIMIDLGSGIDFSPTLNFLKPFISKGKFDKSVHEREKYNIDQMFLSHLDYDHISDYFNFRKYFHPDIMTCPNMNKEQRDHFKINTNLIGDIDDLKQKVLEDMDKRTTDRQIYPKMSVDNPLISITNEIDLYYINPSLCESDPELKKNYANNISLVLFIKIGTKTIFIPGDLSKEGMKYLINSNSSLQKELNDLGIDYLIAPHHGLETSFSEYLFHSINGNKTRLNIISEKVRSLDSIENRSDVDTRYYSSDYSSGENNMNQRGIKTSMGHIVIDLTTPDSAIKQFQNIDDVIKEFQM